MKHRSKAEDEKGRSTTVFAVFIGHLLMIVSVILSLLTGLRIHVAAETDALAILSFMLPQGEVYSIHVISGLILLAVTLYYFAMNFMLARWHRVRLVWSQPLFGTTNLSRLMKIVGLVLLLATLFTGMLLFLESGLLPYGLLLGLHLSLAIMFGFFLVLHPVMAWRAGGSRKLLKIFRPRFEFRLVTLTMLSSSLAGAALFFLVFSYSQTVLDIPMIQGVRIELDGEERETEWQQAQTVVLRTVRGANQPENGVEVRIKAIHDGEYAWFYFKWRDPTRSFKHLPLIKGEDGWQVIQTAATRADENRYYEDKFAVMLSRKPGIAGAGSVQLGHKPMADNPHSSGRRGLHYTTDGSVLDVWHWKAVRTGFSQGQVDDNHFAHAKRSKSEYKRYTAGYQKDLDDCEHLVRWEQGDFQLKPECGGFVMNWKMLDDGVIQPLRLPTENAVLQRMGTINLSPDLSDSGQWWMDWQDTVPYQMNKDHWPVGTIIPSVLSLGPFSQGRGDVSSGARWVNGFWHLEMKRKLVTERAYDLPIEDGIFLWVAVFNHSQTRHSHHLHPLRIRMGTADNLSD